MLVTVYSDADRTGLFEIRSIPSVKVLDIVLGAFDALVTVEGEDDKEIQLAVERISRTEGVKEAKPLIEVEPSLNGNLKQLIRRRA